MATNSIGMRIEEGMTVVGAAWLHSLIDVKDWRIPVKIMRMSSAGGCTLSDGSSAHMDNLVPVKTKPLIIIYESI